MKALRKICRAYEIARGYLESAQVKMKCWFGRNAKNRVFRLGDKVLELLPLPGCSLQARYSGPKVVKEKVGNRDYIFATPATPSLSGYHAEVVKASGEHQRISFLYRLQESE